MPKLVITGGLGFIFSHVTQYFVRKKWEVVVIDNLSVGSHPEIIDGSFVHLNLDMASVEAKNMIIKENPDYIIHAAGITDVDYSISYPVETYRNNVLANLYAFEAARHCPNLKKLLYTSTDEVYGSCEHKKNETEIIFPLNPYSASRADGSLLRMAYDNTYPELRDKTAETRFCNVFGPRQSVPKLIPNILKHIEQKTEFPLHDGGIARREWLYVENIPPVVELILLKGNRVYNITNNDEYSVLEIIKLVTEVLGKGLKIKDSQRAGQDMAYRMDNTRIRALGWEPLFSFQEGLKSYLKYA